MPSTRHVKRTEKFVQLLQLQDELSVASTSLHDAVDAKRGVEETTYEGTHYNLVSYLFHRSWCSCSNVTHL